MIEFRDLAGRKCRYPHGERAPYLFCGEKTKAGSPYCEEHHTLCHQGDGKPWEALAGMIDAIDKTVIVRKRASYGALSDVEPALDDMVREGA